MRLRNIYILPRTSHALALRNPNSPQRPEASNITNNNNYQKSASCQCCWHQSFPFLISLISSQPPHFSDKKTGSERFIKLLKDIQAERLRKWWGCDFLRGLLLSLLTLPALSPLWFLEPWTSLGVFLTNSNSKSYTKMVQPPDTKSRHKPTTILCIHKEFELFPHKCVSVFSTLIPSGSPVRQERRMKNQRPKEGKWQIQGLTADSSQTAALWLSRGGSTAALRLAFSRAPSSAPFQVYLPLRQKRKRRLAFCLLPASLQDHHPALKGARSGYTLPEGQVARTSSTTALCLRTGCVAISAMQFLKSSALCFKEK